MEEEKAPADLSILQAQMVPLTTSYTWSAGSSSRTISLLRGYDLTMPIR
jgi:hypothetical protein